MDLVLRLTLPVRGEAKQGRGEQPPDADEPRTDGRCGARLLTGQGLAARAALSRDGPYRDAPVDGGAADGHKNMLGDQAPRDLVVAGGRQRQGLRVDEVRVGRKVRTVVAIRDQRERLRTEAKIRTLAFNDALTGLPNRTRFHELLTLRAASPHVSDQSFAVLIIDLDQGQIMIKSFRKSGRRLVPAVMDTSNLFYC